METILFLAVAAIVMLCIKLWHQGKVLEKLLIWADSQVKANQGVGNAIQLIAAEVDRHTITLHAVGDYIEEKEGLIKNDSTKSTNEIS